MVVKPKVPSDYNAVINLKRIDSSESSNLLNDKDINAAGFAKKKKRI